VAVEQWARWFLIVVGAIFTVGYALPIAFAPMRWGRAFRWSVEGADTALSLYFARCLGGVAIAMLIVMFRAAVDPRAHPDAFELIALVSAAMTVVHVYGAIARVQPWTEDAEIVVYLAIGGASIWFRLHL